MVSQQQRKPFIYGRFDWPAKSKSKRVPPGLPVFLRKSLDRDRIGIEILREFSATELVGKLYSIGGSQSSWTPVDVSTLEEQDWYRWYRSIPKAALTKNLGRELFSFNVEGSGPWAVLYIRTESDDAGPYVAIALKY